VPERLKVQKGGRNMDKAKVVLSHIVLVLITCALIESDICSAEFIEDPPVYIRQWTVSSPTGTAFDSSGNIYVVDRLNRLVKKYDNGGLPITEWISCGADIPSDCYVPYDIAVDSYGNVYVTDYIGITKFDADGKFSITFGFTGGMGTGIAVPSFVESLEFSGEPAASIYIANSPNHRIQKFDPDGTLIVEWGRYGILTGQFKNPYDVALDSMGNFYVADTFNSRIQKFASDGTFLNCWAVNRPSGIEIDSSDNVYVISWQSCSIEKFTSNGVLLTQWGSCGNEEGKFKGPFRINVSPDGKIYVSDTDNNRIQVFASNDRDYDRVPDTEDNCPEISNPDQNDSDGDSVGNVCDNCPDDLNKIALGVCGCGIADTDSDGDGSYQCYDCNDNNASINPGSNDNTCDGVDNNCNGQTDEGYTPTPTTCGIGACALTGQLTCINGSIQDTCKPGNPAANDVICNEIDEDCDGNIDEDYVATPNSCGLGACASIGQLICSNGTVVNTCTPGSPRTEVCDGVDNNCNGVADEDLTQQCGVSDIGACQYGTQTCGNGAWGACVGNIDPTAEICDGLDNDCDGVVPSDETDTDGDRIPDCNDNCPGVANQGQEDSNSDGKGDACEGGRICSYLGDEHKPFIFDQDIYNFSGKKGEAITVRLDADPSEAGSGKRATLALVDNIKRVFLLRVDRSELPNEISVILPATGKYYIIVAEQPIMGRGKRYRGNYCLTLGASTATLQTLAPL
jgi:streptogramin lyase